MKHLALLIGLSADFMKQFVSIRLTLITKVKLVCSIKNLSAKQSMQSLHIRMRKTLGKCLKGFSTLLKGFAPLARSSSTMDSKKKSFPFS